MNVKKFLPVSNSSQRFFNPPYSNQERTKMANKLIYDPNKLDKKTKEKGVAFHVVRNEERRKHRRYSHKESDLVEWIGKDKKGRGMGIVLNECNSAGLQDGDDHPWDDNAGKVTVKDEEYTHLKVFWQVLMKEEIISKSFVRKVPDREVGSVVITKKTSS